MLHLVHVPLLWMVHDGGQGGVIPFAGGRQAPTLKYLCLKNVGRIYVWRTKRNSFGDWAAQAQQALRTIQNPSM